MNINITATNNFNSNTIIVNLNKNLSKKISELGIRLSNKIKSEKLTGQALKVQTGRLRNSIHSVSSGSNGIYTADIGTNVSYAAVHEYGFYGSVTVSSHTRTITQAFGKSIPSTTFTVSSFVRNMRMPERSFARSALHEFEQTIMNEVSNAVGSSL